MMGVLYAKAFREVAERRNWSPTTQAQVLLDFIESMHLDQVTLASFKAYLKEREEDEDSLATE